MATIPDIVAAVYSEVAGSGLFGSGDTVRRSWLPREDVRDMAVGAVLATVMAQDQTLEVLTRGAMLKTLSVNIAIQCKVEDFEAATVDPLVELAESLASYMFQRALPLAPDAIFMGVNLAPIMSSVHADDFSVFTSVVTVRYKTMENV